MTNQQNVLERHSNHMKKITSLLLSICALASLTAVAESKALTITVVTTFDYPGTGNSTFPFGISSKGDIAGYYVDPSNVTRGFIRLHTGVISGPYVDPNDTGNFTRTLAINGSRVIVGDYYVPVGNVFHGFFLNGHTYTQYDFTGTSTTDLFGLNDAGDFGGTGVDTLAGVSEGFVSFGGTVTEFMVAGSTATSVHGINDLGEAVGSYNDSAGVSHGFYRDASGTITAPVDYPGSATTTVQGINDKGVIVGRYNNADGVVHAFILKLPHTFFSYDYPGATATSFNDINSKGLIAARYTDNANLAHGFIAQER